jgi:soluble lytic murein transglycosylase-like protein
LEGRQCNALFLALANLYNSMSNATGGIYAAIALEAVLWSTIFFGRGLQQIFWYHWRQGVMKAQPVKGLPYAALINDYGTEFRIDPTLIAAVIRCESSFNPQAQSKAGAVGLMQISLPTWQYLKKSELAWQQYNGLEADMQALFQPPINICAGTKYLGLMLSRYQGDPLKAVAAYNAGPGNVDRHNGVPPIEETVNYVHHVAEVWIEYRGVQNIATLCYWWGSYIESNGIRVQKYIYIGFCVIIIIFFVICWVRYQRRRW